MPRTNAGPTVVFRVDSGTRLGSGHIMRCLALAIELRRRGARVVFVSRAHAGHISARVEADAIDAIVMPAAGDGDATSPMLGASQVRDAHDMLQALGARSVDWVVADHYGLGAEWETIVRSHGAKMFVIDDVANRLHTADALLDQNFFGADTPHRYRDLVQARCVTLLGPRYALLHSEYAVLRHVLPLRGRVRRRVLLTFGGSDATNETQRALAALSRPQFSDLAVDVVLGPNHPAPGDVLEAAARRPNTTVHRNVSSLAGLIVRADFALGAAGSTTWERLCLELPSAVVTVADNQVVSTRALAAAGYIRTMGSAPAAVDDYVEALSRIEGGVGALPPLVDGLGVKRVAEVLCPTGKGEAELRGARPDDVSLFFEWRNDDLARAQSFSQEPVSWAVHREWFQRKIGSAASQVFVAEARGLPIGQVRIDFEEGEGVLSYSVDSTVRGRGWGGWLVSEAMKRAWPRDRVVRADVRLANTASRRIFKRLGWVEGGEGDGRVAYRWSPSQQAVGESL